MFYHLGVWFRRLSWITIFLGLMHLSHVEIGFPPDKQPLRKKPPLRTQRLEYLAILAAGAPGALWGITRACKDLQRTPWE